MSHAHIIFHISLSTPAILTATGRWLIMPCCRSKYSHILLRTPYIDTLQAESSELYAIEPLPCPRFESDYRTTHLADYLINTSRRYGIKLGIPFAPTNVQCDVTERLR